MLLDDEQTVAALIIKAEVQGGLVLEDIYELVPDLDENFEQIERIMAALEEAGVRLTDTADDDDDQDLSLFEEEEDEDEDAEEGQATDDSIALYLREMARVLKAGGRLLVLEFSQVARPLRGAYDLYSFKVLPHLGRLVAGDEGSYRYLAESIRMHPNQEELKALMKINGFGHVDYHNMTAGVVALHVGIKCG